MKCCGIARLAVVLAGCFALACAPSGHAGSQQNVPDQAAVHVVLRAKTKTYQGGKWTERNLDEVAGILRKRLAMQGVSPVTLTVKPPDKILLSLPRLPNETAFLNRLLDPADLRFYLLPQLGDKENVRPAIWHVGQEKDPKTGAKNDVLIDNATGKPLTRKQLDAAVFNRPPFLSGRELLPNSRAITVPGMSNPAVGFEFNAKGSRILVETTRSHIGRFLGIFLDKRLFTAPSINGVIPGKGILEGNFTLESAKALAGQLNAGTLPVTLERLSVEPSTK